MDLKVPVVAFELFLDDIPLPKVKARNTRAKLELADLPAVERDFAFVVDQEAAAATLVAAARAADKTLITEVSVFDVYDGEGIEPGKKSIAFSVRLQPTEKTMTEAEIDAVAANIVAAVSKATGGTLRG
jgi:phenylalanyl-tRNA synthetase beta chain